MAKIVHFSPKEDYWSSVTDVPCPCGGTIRWAESGYVPGWRECEACGRQYQAGGDAADPTLEQRRGPTRHGSARRKALAAAESARRQARERNVVWMLLHVLQAQLPFEQDGEIYHPGTVTYDDYVSGDDLDETRRCEAAVLALLDSPGLVAGTIARGIGLLRQSAWPHAWAVWTELRHQLPRCIKIEVSPDGAQVRLVGCWQLGTYPAEAVRQHIAWLREVASSLVERPVGAHDRVRAQLSS